MNIEREKENANLRELFAKLQEKKRAYQEKKTALMKGTEYFGYVGDTYFNGNMSHAVEYLAQYFAYGMAKHYNAEVKLLYENYPHLAEEIISKSEDVAIRLHVQSRY